jgi:DnaJ-domain-containing protein 1
MGVNRAARGFREEGAEPQESDPLGMFRARQRRPAEPKGPKYGLAVMKALTTLGLDDTADAEAIKNRYKEWVKRLHPDANAGDRSREDKLREIIQAYNYLRTAKIV